MNYTFEADAPGHIAFNRWFQTYLSIFLTPKDEFDRNSFGLFVAVLPEILESMSAEAVEKGVSPDVAVETRLNFLLLQRQLANPDKFDVAPILDPLCVLAAKLRLLHERETPEDRTREEIKKSSGLLERLIAKISPSSLLNSLLGKAHPGRTDQETDPPKKKQRIRHPSAEGVACGKYVRREIQRDPTLSRKKAVISFVESRNEAGREGKKPDTLDRELQDNPHLWK